MPVIDYDNGGSALEFVSTIDAVLELDFDTMIPGHGRPMAKDEARAYRVRFQAMNDRARGLIRKGCPRTASQSGDITTRWRPARKRGGWKDGGWNGWVDGRLGP